MHTVRSTFYLLAPLAIASLLSAGCGAQGGSPDGSSDDRPGHGASSRTYDVASGDHTDAYDTTDDPTDPSFVPTASPKLPAPAADVETSSSAVSSTVGTRFELTYYVVSQRPAGDPSQVSLYDCDGNFLTHASKTWKADALMQGTAQFNNSSGSTVTINDGGGCWVTLPTSEKWGLGVENPATGNEFVLKPFRSIAVDPGTLTIGRWYYVKELDGVKMPSPSTGMVHDGCVRAMDVGPAINGKHIDFFVGWMSAYHALAGGSSTIGGLDYVTLYSGTTKCAQHIAQGY